VEGKVGLLTLVFSGGQMPDQDAQVAKAASPRFLKTKLSGRITDMTQRIEIQQACRLIAPCTVLSEAETHFTGTGPGSRAFWSGFKPTGADLAPRTPLLASVTAADRAGPMDSRANPGTIKGMPHLPRVSDLDWLPESRCRTDFRISTGNMTAS